MVYSQQYISPDFDKFIFMGKKFSIEQTFGQVIKALRNERRLSQEKLADTSDLDRSFISHLERGVKQPSLITIFQLAKALKLPVSKIMSLVEEELQSK